VFASGAKFGFLADAPEWDDFFGLLIGDVWRPPQRAAVSSKYVNIVYNKLVADVNPVLAALSGGCLHFDGWTDPNGGQVFNVMFGAPLPFHITSFRISSFRETAEKLVSSIYDVMAKLLPPTAMTSADVGRPCLVDRGQKYRRRHGLPICDAQGACHQVGRRYVCFCV
jgi:hypothetical protein